ncbi:MAG: NPCBM/NEW2 domain-containing protein [Mariniphaga sp.]
MKQLTLFYALLLCINTSIGSPGIIDQQEKNKQVNPSKIAKDETTKQGEVVLLSSLKMDEALCAERPQINRSFGVQPLMISGQKFETGLGTHARCVLWISLQGGSQRFTSFVGIDDEVVPRIVRDELRSAFLKGYDEYKKVNGHVIFQIYGDGRLLWKSPLMQAGMPAQKVDVDLSGVQTMVMVVSSSADAVEFDHADWADAFFIVSGAKPQPMAPPSEAASILTPKGSPKPRINGAKVFGVRPGSPFLFAIAATGDRPIKFEAKKLPQGLTLDPASGQISGVLKSEGSWNVTVKASNSLGISERVLKIVCGPTLALTPPMGWNSWNVFSRSVNESHVRAAADAMISSGLVNHGWNYVNIDDCWQIKHSSKDSMLVGKPRDENGMINPNKKFPDMKALCDYIHSKGLKAGIYSSPGLYTCQGHTGSFQYEEQDAQRYAAWGFDYLKYDWCYNQYSSKDVSLYEQRIPWATMAKALVKTKRDMVFSLSETLDVWPWAKETGANCWRTTGDITDLWSSIDGIGFTQNGREIVAGPGHWNDCDMFVVGRMSGGKSPTRLTPNEQYMHVSLWCLLASPLLIGCDMTQLDDFTLNLLTNDEVIEVNQDPLGKQAHRISKDESVEVWAKQMEDGTLAVGLFNRGEFENPVTIRWSDLGIKGKQTVRDLWRQKDSGIFTDTYTASVARHGAVLIRIRPVGK